MDTAVRTQLVGDVVAIFSSHLGSVTADMYMEFYKDKDAETIYSSATSLLSEFLGSAKSESLITGIRSKYHLTEETGGVS